MVSGSDVPLNQSIETAIPRWLMPRLGSVEDALCVSALRQHSVDAVLNAAYSGCSQDEAERTRKDGEKVGVSL
jgi:hypothetical protein